MSNLWTGSLSWWYGLKLARKGKKFRFKGSRLHIDGHVEVGDHVQIRDNCVLRTSREGKIIFGNNCGISWNCIIESNSRVEIVDFTGIAESFKFLRSAALAATQ